MPTSVFVSSTFRDLREHRAAVQKSLLDAGLHPVGMESFGAQPVEPTAACLEEVRGADVFVGIYAWRYGFIPEGGSTSVTEQELDEARRSGKPCFCFVVDEVWPWPEGFREEGSGADRLRTLKARIDRELTRTTFTSPEDLAARLLASLQRWERQPRSARPRAVEAGDLRDRQILLERVRSFWIEGLLDRVAEEMPLQALPKETHSTAVIQPWQDILEAPGPDRQPLLVSRTAFELFEDSGRALLVLGAPGSGKTITLLELARDAAEQANRDPGQPIPVIFNLSTWGRRQTRLIDWLTDELATKYQIPRKTGRLWLEADSLLLLLDGLDEVPEVRRPRCVAAINRFREEQGLTALAVGCRLGDYEALGVKLMLGAAVVLRSLELGQVEALTHGGPGLDSLRQVLTEDSGLRELAASPFLLAVMRRAYSELPVEELLDPRLSEPGARRRHLFTAYVDRVLRRRGGELPYRREKLLGWLGWLARGMDQRNQSVFLVEDLQPGWLEKKRDLILYSLAAAFLPALAIAAFVLVGSVRLAAGVMTAFLVVGAIDGIAQAVLRSQDARPWRWRILRALLVFVGVTLVCLPVLRVYFAPSSALFYSLIVGVWSAVAGLRETSWDADARIRSFEDLAWSWRHALRNLTFVFSPGWPFFMALLGSTLVIIGSNAIVEELGGIGGTRERVLAHWPVLAFLVVFVFAGFERRTKDYKSYPNQGIWLSGRHGLIFGLAGTLINLLPFVLSAIRYDAYALGESEIAATINDTSWSLSGRVFFGYLWISCLLGLCLGLLNGGLDFLRHFLLRLFLSLAGKLPLGVVGLLDLAADRALLYKVGGGYVFIHRLLLEHFAFLQSGPEKPSADSGPNSPCLAKR